MATQFVAPAGHHTSALAQNAGPTANLSIAQTGTGASTNVADRGSDRGPAVVEIVSTVGATPTVTVAIEGSMDGGDWYAVAYSDTPISAASVSTFAITTATTTRKFLPAGHAWRHLRLNYTANTNVTLTADVMV